MNVSPLDKKIHRLTVAEARLFAELSSPQTEEDERQSGEVADDFSGFLDGAVVADALQHLAENTCARLISSAEQTLNPTAVLQRFQARGHNVSQLSDLQDLGIDEIEAIAGRLCFKYQAMAIGEGGGADCDGVPRFLVDIPALVDLAFRAVREIGMHYGFDASLDIEKKFALMILSITTGNHDLRVQLDHAALTTPIGHVEPLLSDELCQQVAEALVMELIRGKVVEGPPAGGVIGRGTFNPEFVQRVGKTARTIYRERWLLERYSIRGAAAE